MTNRADIVHKIILIEPLLELLIEPTGVIAETDFVAKERGSTTSTDKPRPSHPPYNVIIGGSAALILHGLKLSRHIDDIDVIIYNASRAQLKVLNTLKIADAVNSDFGYGEKRVIKIVINDVKVDIIVVNEPTPFNLLVYSIVSRSFTGLLIQSIDEVIKAKMSYTLANKKGELDTYRRSKDFIDMLDLKNSNFNL